LDDLLLGSGLGQAGSIFVAVTPATIAYIQVANVSPEHVAAVVADIHASVDRTRQIVQDRHLGSSGL
jgi:hypothetical protein